MLQAHISNGVVAFCTLLVQPGQSENLPPNNFDPQIVGLELEGTEDEPFNLYSLSS